MFYRNLYSRFELQNDDDEKLRLIFDESTLISFHKNFSIEYVIHSVAMRLSVKGKQLFWSLNEENIFFILLAKTCDMWFCCVKKKDSFY